MLKCYRVWFRDGTAVLVDAANTIDAKGRATLIRNTKIAKIECLDKS